MKTNLSAKIFNLSSLLVFGIAIIAALVARPVCGSVINSLVLTENSSTDLSGTYTTIFGTTEPVTITFVSADHWNVTVSTASFTPHLALAWEEPEKSNPANLINSTPSIDTLNIFSDTSGVEVTRNPNGTPLLCGTDSGNLASINVSFFDKSDVPDAGSTLGLLSVALAVLFGASRLPFPRTD